MAAARPGQDPPTCDQPLARPAHRPAPPLVALTALVALAAVAGCVPAHHRPSWRLFPLQRQQPHDGLAVVSQPDGYGLHIWLETDTRRKGFCRPRWLPDPARLFNGNGSHPFSSGLASREEFFSAVARRDVRQALRRELKALCLSRAPRSTWEWVEPPLNPSQVKVETLPMLEEEDLLTDPETIRQQEQDPEQENPTEPEADAANP